MTEYEHNSFEGSPQPEPNLDIPTINDFRRRLIAHIFAQEVAIVQLQTPRFALPEPKTDIELLSAARELDNLRQEYQDEKLRRDGEFNALWAVSNLVDEQENDAIKQQEAQAEN